MADRVPQASEAPASVTLTKKQINAWRHAIVTAGYRFDEEANRLLKSIAELPVIDAAEANVEGAKYLARYLKQQAREAWAAADLLEEAAEVTIRTATEGGAA